MKNVSAWELRRKMAKLHGYKLTEELYQWFCSVKKTLGYESAGTWLLLSLPESDAIQVLANAHERINGGGIPWHEFVATEKSEIYRRFLFPFILFSCNIIQATK